MADEMIWDRNAKSSAVVRLKGQHVYILDVQDRILQTYILRDMLREEELWIDAFQRQPDCTLPEQVLQHGRNGWANFAELGLLVKPSYKPEALIQATEEALLAKLQGTEGVATDVAAAGAGEPPSLSEGQGPAGEHSDQYYLEYYASQADITALREEMEAAHAEIWNKLEAMADMVTTIHQKICPEERGVHLLRPLQISGLRLHKGLRLR